MAKTISGTGQAQSTGQDDDNVDSISTDRMADLTASVAPFFSSDFILLSLFLKKYLNMFFL